MHSAIQSKLHGNGGPGFVPGFQVSLLLKLSSCCVEGGDRNLTLESGLEINEGSIQ